MSAVKCQNTEPLWDEEPNNSEEREKKVHNYSSRTFMQSKRNSNVNDQNQLEKDKNQPYWKNSDDNERNWRNRSSNTERRTNYQQEKQNWGNYSRNNERKQFDSSTKVNWNNKPSNNERRQYNDKERSNWRNKYSTDERQENNDHSSYGRRNKYNEEERQVFNDRQRPNWKNKSNDDSQDYNRRSNWNNQHSNQKDFESNEPSNWKNKYGNNNRDYDKSNFRNHDSEEKIVMKVAAGLTGRVIGRQGTMIRSLEESSQTRIKVITHEGQETDVEITGSESGREKAKELIEELLSREYPSKPEQNNRKYEMNGQNKENTNTSQFKQEANTKKETPTINWKELIAASQEEKTRRWEKLPPVKKNFYFEDPKIASMTSEEVSEFRKMKNNIVIQKLEDDDSFVIPNPVSDFHQAFKNYPDILREISKQGFEEPSPIQCQAWPILLQGHDMIGIAQTGTGKTLAFLLPALIHIDQQITPRNERGGPSCLVFAPTRELAQQIERECRKYEYKDIKCVCIYGGGNRREQINSVEKGVEIVIATPGRLNDLVMHNILDVTCVTYLVLDEADRMLDMGFEPQIKKVLLDIRPDRQTVMTSATWPEGVRRMASLYMTKPVLVFIGSLDIRAVHSVNQEVLIVSDEEKKQMLYEFIDNMTPEDKVIVFVDKKVIADDLASDLLLNGVECQSIHGDREQSDREQAIEDLRTGIARILIATDIASRGLDIKDITHIFNYDFPRNIEEYVHRVGRTGRAGQTGSSITLMTRNDWSKAKHLIEIMEEAGQEIPQELMAMADRYQLWKTKRDAEDAAARRPGRFVRNRRDY